MHTNTQIHTGPVLELVICRAKEGASDEEIIAVADSLMPLLHKAKAFVRRELRRAPDGRWVDLVWWTDIEGGQAAGAEIHAGPEGKRLDELLVEEGMIYLPLSTVRIYESQKK